jgi:putative tryptophan/tyrosine transport system substrate-binding protein
MAPLEPRRSPIRRRDFIGLIGSVATTGPSTLLAQPAGPLRLVGVLMGFGEGDRQSRALIAEFRAALANLGWKEGSNLRTELRWGAGDVARIADFAKELVALKPDALLGQTTPVAVSLARETKSIPIIFVTVSDPIGSGLAASLAHPGGNVTGFTFVESTVGGRWVQLLKEIAPRTMHVVLLFNPTTAPPLKFYLPGIQTAASSFAIETSTAPVHEKVEIEGVVAAAARNPGGALIVMPDAFNATHRELIIALAARYGVPAIYGNNFAESGGLIFYGADFAETFRLGADYIDRILKGAKPGELPIQLPTRFALSINLKTAKALGLEVPLSLQQRADEVIE